MTSRITLENVTLSYRRHPAVHHLSGCFEAGSLTAITGPNGAGKSTLLKALAGLIKPDGGRIIRESTTRIAYLPQVAELRRDMPITVLQLASMGLWHITGTTGALTPTLLAKATDALAQVGLQDLKDREISTLSAGQFQRALIARTLLQDASLILLDEPFAGVDPIAVLDIQKIIAYLKGRGIGVLITDHNVRETLGICDRAYIINAGEVLASGTPAEIIYNESVRKVYLGEHFRL
jgi:lipopolysaccharide export system ATP-binding protein